VRPRNRPAEIVDPERDTPEQMKSYAENFDSRLIALTGSAAQVAEVGELADGVVVGSALVRLVEEHGADPALPALVEARVRELSAPLRRRADRRAESRRASS